MPPKAPPPPPAGKKEPASPPPKANPNSTDDAPAQSDPANNTTDNNTTTTTDNTTTDNNNTTNNDTTTTTDDQQKEPQSPTSPKGAPPKKAPPKKAPESSSPKNDDAAPEDDKPADDSGKQSPPPGKKQAPPPPASKKQPANNDDKPKDDSGKQSPPPGKKQAPPPPASKAPPKEEREKDNGSKPPPPKEEKESKPVTHAGCPFPLEDPGTIEVRFTWRGDLLRLVVEPAVASDAVRIDLYEQIGRTYGLSLYDVYVGCTGADRAAGTIEFVGAYRVPNSLAHNDIMDSTTRYLGSAFALREPESLVRHRLGGVEGYMRLIVEKVYYPRVSGLREGAVSDRGQMVTRPGIASPNQDEFMTMRAEIQRNPAGPPLQRPRGGFGVQDLILGEMRYPGRYEPHQAADRYGDAPRGSKYGYEGYRGADHYYEERRQYHDYRRASQSPTRYERERPVQMVEYYSQSEPESYYGRGGSNRQRSPDPYGRRSSPYQSSAASRGGWQSDSESDRRVSPTRRRY